MCKRLMVNTNIQRKRTKMVQWILLLLAAMAFLFPEFIAALKDVSVTIPQAVKRGSNALLVCNYDMENDTLYSVKWYKGRREFYRYTPKENPAMKVFPVTSGLNVERNLSNQSHVVLLSVPLNISGKFTCEISVEAPSFQTAMVSGEMEVVELPEQQATVTGIQPRYRIGDLVDGNCSIKFSKPAANLTWTINGIVVPPHHIKMYQIEKYEDHNLESVVSAINFMVTTQHFIKSQMKLKCTASIFNIYVEEIENIIEEDRPRIMASGRSYDMNAYPYDQHSSGDGFEDHNESYLTYYSAADITSSAAPSARLMYVKLGKIFHSYWTNFLSSLLSTTKTISTYLAESHSTSAKSAALSTVSTSKTSLSSSSSSPLSSSSSSTPSSSTPSLKSTTSLVPRKVKQKTFTARKQSQLSTLVASTFAPLTPSSIKRNVKCFFAQFLQRFKVENQIENAHKMEICVKGKKFKNSERVQDEFNDQRNNDDDGNNDDDDNDDDEGVDGDDAANSWHFSAKCIRGAFIAAVDIELMAWSIAGLSVVLMMLCLNKSNQQLQRSKQNEWQQQQQLLHQFQQDSCCSCQNNTTTTATATTLTLAVVNGTKWQLHPEHSSWLFNDFLSADQTYTLQDIKVLKSFYNCQYEDTNVKQQQSKRKAVSIAPIAKWHRKGCQRQLSMIIMMLLLLTILMTMVMTRSLWRHENVAKIQHFIRNVIENNALSLKTLAEELPLKRELLLGKVSKLTKMATFAFYENDAIEHIFYCC